jgi:hypothetical protein
VNRTGNYAFFALLAMLFALGGYIGVALSRHPKLEWFKLLNIVGLACDLLGIIVLSEIAIRSAKISQFFVDWVAGFVLWGQTVIPLGAAVGAWLLGRGPSTSIVTQFFVSFFVYSLTFLAVLEGFVFDSGARRQFGVAQRSRAFGLWLLFVGTVVQLVAAFRDLYA